MDYIHQARAPIAEYGTYPCRAALVEDLLGGGDDPLPIAAGVGAQVAWFGGRIGGHVQNPSGGGLQTEVASV